MKAVAARLGAGCVLRTQLKNTFDGDTMSANLLMGDEAIREANERMNDPASYLDARGGFYNNPFTEVVQRVLANMTGGE